RGRRLEEELRVHPVQVGAEIVLRLAGTGFVPTDEQRRREEIRDEREAPRSEADGEMPEDGRAHRGVSREVRAGRGSLQLSVRAPGAGPLYQDAEGAARSRAARAIRSRPWISIS